jgi:hypothetical protein
MGQKIVHPLWVHLPAVAALVVLMAGLAISGPLPAEAPIHFSFDGIADNYGSPWAVFGLVIGLSVLYILLSALLDELWARQEKAKAFNWLSLLDEAIVGVLAGIGLGYLVYLGSGQDQFIFPWGWFGWLGGGAVALGVILELVRPYRSWTGQLVDREDRDLKMELERRVRDGSPFVFWDYQNPFYVTLLSTLLPAGLLLAAIFAWFDIPWVSLLLAVVAAFLIISYGGQRTLVTREGVAVRWGILGLRVLRLKVADIAAVDIHEFSPLRDFGGYGIRFNREMKAYFLRGTRGVVITTIENKKYLIGSDRPERLLAVLEVVSGKHG